MTIHLVCHFWHLRGKGFQNMVTFFFNFGKGMKMELNILIFSFLSAQSQKFTKNINPQPPIPGFSSKDKMITWENHELKSIFFRNYNVTIGLKWSNHDKIFNLDFERSEVVNLYTVHFVHSKIHTQSVKCVLKNFKIHT